MSFAGETGNFILRRLLANSFASIAFNMKLKDVLCMPTAPTYSKGLRLPKKCLHPQAYDPLEIRSQRSLQGRNGGSKLAGRGLSVGEENIVDQDFMDELNKVLVCSSRLLQM